MSVPNSPLAKAGASCAVLRTILIMVGVAIAVGGAVALVLLQLRGPGSYAQIGAPFVLTDQHGVERRDSEFRGKFMLIYFGYTSCPDLCPTALNDMALALDGLGTAARMVQPIFVTVDPERDTPEKLAPYAAFFHPRLIALTGPEDRIADLARSYRVFYAKIESADPGEPYQVNHTSVIYLMDPDGHYVSHFPHDVRPEEMENTMRSAIQDWTSPQ